LKLLFEIKKPSDDRRLRRLFLILLTLWSAHSDTTSRLRIGTHAHATTHHHVVRSISWMKYLKNCFAHSPKKKPLRRGPSYSFIKKNLYDGRCPWIAMAHTTHHIGLIEIHLFDCGGKYRNKNIFPIIFLFIPSYCLSDAAFRAKKIPVEPGSSKIIASSFEKAMQLCIN
jgi:hypothetical protein